MPWARQLVDQRFVRSDPLVQRTASLKYQRLRQIGTNLAHADLTYNSVITNSTDYIFSDATSELAYCDSLYLNY